jgi:hypothetical protein
MSTNDAMRATYTANCKKSLRSLSVFSPDHRAAQSLANRRLPQPTKSPPETLSDFGARRCSVIPAAFLRGGFGKRS